MSSTTGNVTDNGNGTFEYDPNGQFEALNAGAQTTDSFSYTVQDVNGASDTATMTITINGINDPATIGGDNAGNMTEDDNGDAGVMSVTDVDNGENVFQSPDQYSWHIRNVQYQCSRQLGLYSNRGSSIHECG